MIVPSCTEPTVNTVSNTSHGFSSNCVVNPMLNLLGGGGNSGNQLIQMQGEKVEHATVKSQAFDENGKQVGGKNVHKLIRKGSGRWYVDDYEIRF